MASYDQRSLELPRWQKQRSSSSGVRELWQRTTRMLAGAAGGDLDTQATAVTARLPEEADAGDDKFAPRFPLARHGYDRLAVDRRVAQLERDLAEADRELVALRTGADSSEQVKNEIRRVGEQTSAVLVAAHQQRDEMLRNAKAEADRVLSGANANARAITAKAEARVRELDAQNEAVRRERARLLDDFRTLATGLGAVVDAAQERIPVE